MAPSRVVQVRAGAMACLQRTVVAAERLAVPASGLSRALTELLLPLGHDLTKLLHAKDMPQVRVHVWCGCVRVHACVGYV